MYSQLDIGYGQGFSVDNTDTLYHTPFPINPSSYYPSSDSTVTNIQTILLHTYVGTRLLLDDYKLSGDLYQAIAECTWNGTCAAACNISFNQAEDCAGTAAFIVHATQEDADPLIGTNWTTEPKVDQCYWSELGGIIGFLVSINIVVHFYKINSSKITLKCDNEEAVDQASGN